MRPGVIVTGGEYPLPPTRALLSKVISILQIAVFIFPIFGHKIDFIRNHPWYQIY